jgi:hypothetical protein
VRERERERLRERESKIEREREKPRQRKRPREREREREQKITVSGASKVTIEFIICTVREPWFYKILASLYHIQVLLYFIVIIKIAIAVHLKCSWHFSFTQC